MTAVHLNYLLNPCNRDLLEKLPGSQSRNSPYFMEPEGSLSQLHVNATCPYHKSPKLQRD